MRSLPLSLLTCLRTLASVPILLLALLVGVAGCDAGDSSSGIPAGVRLEPVSPLPSPPPTTGPGALGSSREARPFGLAKASGGAHLKLLRTGTSEVQLPLPQLTASQIPLHYTIATVPTTLRVAYHLQSRAGSDVVLSVRLSGQRNDEIHINWSAVVLFPSTSNTAAPISLDDYRQPTACVQSTAPAVIQLAEKLWPADGGTIAYAGRIQDFIRDSKPLQPPRSLDAIGILASGANGICTANANLAAALLRAKNIPARSLAVIPLLGQRLEMHRIVEFFASDRWQAFDPSSLRPERPLPPGHQIIVATTTVADENVAMLLRPGASPGCPYGQELEILDSGVTLWGQDFFWTLGESGAEFSAAPAAATAARQDWLRFLATGRISAAQTTAAQAANAASFAAAWSGSP